MKKIYTIIALFSISLISAQDLIITAVFDGPLTGGHPKGVELLATADIQDLSLYGIGSANNGGGTDGVEYTFPADALTAGDFIYVAANQTGFTDFFGFASTYINGAANINGDDAIELFFNDSVVDLFGDINADGTGTAWDHLDGWAYRKNGVSASTTFNVANWTFSGPNALDGETSNSTATSPIPVGTFDLTSLSFDELFSSQIKIYPNPVESQLNISGLNTVVEATVFDMLGRRQLQSEVINSLDVSGLKSGLYMVEIKSETSSKVFKMLKQ